MTWLELLWGWSGRLNRIQYIVGLLSCALAATIFLYALLYGLAGAPTARGWIVYGPAFFSLPSLIILPFMISMMVRRAHDLGISNYILNWFFLYAVAANLVGFAAPGSWIAWIVIAPGAVAASALYVVPGNSGDNAFGAPPPHGLALR